MVTERAAPKFIPDIMQRRFYNCDQAWGDTSPYPGTVPANLAANSGFTPEIGKWHHIAYTFSGSSGVPANLLSVFIDGVVATTVSSRALNILRPFNGLTIGGYVETNNGYTNGANLAIARMRIHDGALSAADVMSNWMTEQVLFIPSQTATASTTASPSSTQVNSFSSTPSTSISSSNTPSASVTPSGTPCPQTWPFTVRQQVIASGFGKK